MSVAEAMAAVEEVRDVIAEAKTDAKKARERLAELEQQMPALLAGERLGHVSEGEVEAVRAELSEVRSFLDETPLLLKGLAAVEAERVKAMEKTRKAEQRTEDEARYAECRKRFEDSCRAGVTDRHAEQDYRQIAHQTGHIDADRKFIAEMIKLRDRTPPPGN